jgi:hypothetical protein
VERRLRYDARCESRQVWSIILVLRNGVVEGVYLQCHSFVTSLKMAPWAN